MSGQIDTFGMYVELRLDAWGQEFSFARDFEYLGHKSKDMLHILREHKGEMPPRATGFKPMEVPLEPLEIERIVADMATADLTMATVLRAWYCGSGRRRVERLNQANEMLRVYAREGIAVRPLRWGTYRVLRLRGFEWVRGVLIGRAQAAA